MKTDALIAALAQDAAGAGPPPGRAIGLALAAGAIAGLAVFMTMLGPRHDLPSAMHSLRFQLKFVVTAAAFLAGLVLALQLASPGRRATPAMLLPLFGVVAATVLWEAASVPQSQWAARLIGVNAAICVASIPVIALAPLAAILLALRSAAPTRPARAGAAAGLLAGAVAATFYGSHCPDNSPFFVAVWYSLGIGIVVLAGTLLGRRLLRW